MEWVPQIRCTTDVEFDKVGAITTLHVHYTRNHCPIAKGDRRGDDFIQNILLHVAQICKTIFSGSLLDKKP